MDFQPNPLNAHNLRVVSHCLLHFYTVDFDLRCKPKKVTDWIYENLSGRFYFGDVMITEDGATVMRKRAAFEIHSEASYFALILSDVNKF